MNWRAPLTVAILMLLLPLAYFGSYLALVVPTHVRVDRIVCNTPTEFLTEVNYERYRFGGKYSERVFWPLEQLDRRIRQETWNPTWDHFRTGRAEVLPAR